MLRFIFVCMGVVALSLVAIAAQYMTGGISDQADAIMARNQDSPQDNIHAVAASDEISAEDLDAIETTAGTPSYDPNDKFSGGFTNEAPKALADDAKAPTAPATMEAPDAQQAN